MTQLKDTGTATEYIKFIEVAYELLSLLKLEGAASHVQHIASSMHIASMEVFPNTLSAMFYDLTEAAEYASDTSTEKYFPNVIKAVRKQLKELVDESIINPTPSGDDKEILDACSYPIILQMMKSPDKSPSLFLELVRTLDRAVSEEQLSILAAAKEIQYTTDRPQIVNSPDLKQSVALAYELELPGTFRKNDPKTSWQTFVDSLPDHLNA